MHMVLGHPDTFQWNTWSTMADIVCKPLIHMGQWQDSPPRQFDTWSFDAGKVAQDFTNLPKRQIAIA